MHYSLTECIKIISENLKSLYRITLNVEENLYRDGACDTKINSIDDQNAIIKCENIIFMTRIVD